MEKFKKGDRFKSKGETVYGVDVDIIITFDSYLEKEEKTEHWDCVVESEGILLMYDTKSLIEEDIFIGQ